MTLSDLQQRHAQQMGLRIARLALLLGAVYVGIEFSGWVDSLGYVAYTAYLGILPTMVLLMTARYWAGFVIAMVTRTDAAYWKVVRAMEHLMTVGVFVMGFFLGHAYRITTFEKSSLLWIVMPVLTLMLFLSIARAVQESVNYGPRGVVLGRGLAASPRTQQGDTAKRENVAPVFPSSYPKSGLDGLAGMAELKVQLRTTIMPFATYRKKTGPIADRNGILLYGPPGNGKTVFAQAIAGELGMRFMKLAVSDLVTKWVNGTPEVLRELFAQAQKEPTLLFFDEFDAIATSRSGDGNVHHEDKKAVNALLALIDEARKHRIVLIAATNYPDNLDTAIVRDGRFDFRIEIPYPDAAARTAIIRGLCAKHQITVEQPVIEKVAALWERRSVAFIESTIKRLRDNGHGVRGKSTSLFEFKLAAREASRRSSAIPREGPKVSELVLPSSVQVEVASLLHRLRNWETINERGGETPSGVLLYGPPGTGKTQLVRALARELGDWHVFEVNTTDVLRDPRKFRTLVDQAADHRPAFVFLDEADELLRDRSMSHTPGATNEILKSMDGLMGRVPELVFVAATNSPDALDAAAVRGGRFGEKILLPRLSGEDLTAFLVGEFAKRKNVRFSDTVTPNTLSELFVTIAPADALAILRKAVNYTLSSDTVRPVEMNDVERALKSVIDGLH